MEKIRDFKICFFGSTFIFKNCKANSSKTLLSITLISIHSIIKTSLFCDDILNSLKAFNINSQHNLIGHDPHPHDRAGKAILLIFFFLAKFKIFNTQLIKFELKSSI